ncbi:MAG: septum formation protein Maf [Bacteroidales bacterium]|nr:septum formation protein Maf [Candidatus Colimorpha onthohippi]
MELLLASKSPRRRQLITALDIPTSFIDIAADETISGDIDVSKAAETIAIRKADAYPASNLLDHQLLITADTIVAINNKQLGKPSNPESATQMLRLLSGKTHVVYTGVCLKSKTCQKHFTESTYVTFRTLTDNEINYYVNHYKPFDKAGSYGIQEWVGMVGITSIQGDYYNVMGLPTARLYQEIMSWEL